MLLTSDEIAQQVYMILRDHAQEHYLDIDSQDELVDITDVVLEGSVVTVTITDIRRTETQRFVVTVRG